MGVLLAAWAVHSVPAETETLKYLLIPKLEHAKLCSCSVRAAVASGASIATMVSPAEGGQYTAARPL